jgi:hypothetical protein
MAIALSVGYEIGGLKNEQARQKGLEEDSMLASTTLARKKISA